MSCSSLKFRSSCVRTSRRWVINGQTRKRNLLHQLVLYPIRLLSSFPSGVLRPLVAVVHCFTRYPYPNKWPPNPDCVLGGFAMWLGWFRGWGRERGTGCGRGVGLSSGGETGLTIWLAPQVNGGKHTMGALCLQAENLMKIGPNFA